MRTFFLAAGPRSSVASYNHQLPQSALKSKLPIQSMKNWCDSHSRLFHKRPYDRPRCGTYQCQTGVETQILGLSLDNEVGQVRAHLQGKPCLETKPLISIVKVFKTRHEVTDSGERK